MPANTAYLVFNGPINTMTVNTLVSKCAELVKRTEHYY